MANPTPLSLEQQKEVLDAITRIEWDRDTPEEVALYLGNEMTSQLHMPMGSFLAGIAESLQQFIAGLLQIPSE